MSIVKPESIQRLDKILQIVKKRYLKKNFSRGQIMDAIGDSNDKMFYVAVYAGIFKKVGYRVYVYNNPNNHTAAEIHKMGLKVLWSLHKKWAQNKKIRQLNRGIAPSDTTIQNCIDILKAAGYKIMREKKEYEEV